MFVYFHGDFGEFVNLEYYSPNSWRRAYEEDALPVGRPNHMSLHSHYEYHVADFSKSGQMERAHCITGNPTSN